MNYGRYETTRELGRGAMGVVYEARDPQIGRIVALKILRPDRVATESFVYRFLKEARAIGRLSHPNVVTVYDIGEDQGTVFIAMEYVEGEPLANIARKRRWTQDEIVNLGIDIAETLHYAHQKGIIHRDIKPSNIIITPEGKIKITDFGIAHIEDPSSSLQTQAGEILGTPAYMSPEQVLSRPVDGRSDLFSLGIILYELATGRRPFEGESLAAVFNAITQGSPAEPSGIDPTLRREFSELLMKCLRKDPNERFESGMALAEALRNVNQEKISAPSREHKVKVRQKTMASWMVVVIILIIGIGGFSYYFLSGRSQSPGTSEKTSTLPAGIDPGIKSTSLDVPETKQPPLDEKGKRPEGPPLSTAPEKRTAVLSPPDQERKTPKGPQFSSIPESKTEAPPVSEKRAHLPPVPPAGRVKETFLRVESTPVGAQVFVDGTMKGKTPVRLGLPAGKHEIRLALSEYFDWEAQVQLSEGSETPLIVQLVSEAEKAP